jgi:hypothetical protein
MGPAVNYMFVYSDTLNGNLSYLFFDATVTGYIVPNNTVLFSMTFNCLPNITNTISSVVFTDSPTQREIDTLDEVGFPSPYFGTSTYVNNRVNIITPIKLQQFAGKNVEGSNQLTWTTLSEINANTFVIERSNNGKEFDQISTVAAFGNTATHKTYNYNDNAISENNTWYYRLKMVDNDGSFDYSKTIRIAKTTKGKIQLSPNPVKNVLTVDAANITNIKIIDQAGKVVANNKYNSTNTALLNISNLCKGMYIVHVTTTEQTFTEKLIKE